MDVDGIPFVAEGRHQRVLSGLRIDVREIRGCETLVAYHSDLSESC